MAHTYLYIFPTINKIKMTYFGNFYVGIWNTIILMQLKGSMEDRRPD